jgi:hypothetical protein
MKLTPARIKILTFMSGTYGRLTRVALGIMLVALALIDMGWGLLLLIPAAMMLFTAAINYCPATLIFPTFKKDSAFSNKYPTYKLK